MPEETITIGGKTFEVACQPGEEHFLRAAAAMLDAEATALIGQIGRLPEARMLLMAGLMLADKMAGAEDRIKMLEGELAAAKAEVEALKSRPRQQVEVARIPEDAVSRLSELAARAEALADQLDGKA
ncbi:MAG: cell division protein ZapA [Pararhodobacter sp.]